MDRLLIALPIVLGAIGLAFVVQRRPPAAPSQPVEHVVPSQLDRADFGSPLAEWLVVAFTSATCGTCADVVSKVRILESDDVAVRVVDYETQRPLHDRYNITAVPSVVMTGSDGVVAASFMGAVSAAHLWAAVARMRSGEESPGDLGCG